MLLNATVSIFVKIFRLCPVVRSVQVFTNVGWATWLCGSIYWRRCSRWNWQGQSSGAVLDWRRSDIKCPSLYAWVWPSEVAVGEASTQARRKARRASCECKADAGSNLGRARDCWKIGNAVLHLHTNKCVHCMVLCLWAPDLRESNARRVFTSFPQSLARWTFSNYFNQSLEQVTLPSNLQGLSLGWKFNQSLERVTLPSSLQSLSFGNVFNQSLERVTLPSSLQNLSFGHGFNQSLERVTLPSSLQSFSAYIGRRLSVSSDGCA